ncbi:MAG: PAS domain S-box protein, partial [Flavisolibacter sp.]
MSSTFSNIMFRSLKDKELTFSESTLRDIISGSPLPTWIISSKNLQVVFANNAVADQFGYSYGKTEENFDQYFAENIRSGLVSKFSEKKFKGTFDFFKRDGKKIKVQLHSSPLLIGDELYHQVAVNEIQLTNGKVSNTYNENGNPDAENFNYKNNESELKLLAQLVEQTSDVLTASDIEFKPITWNSAAQSVYGLTKEQVIGKDLSTLINFQYHNTTREEIRKIISERNEWRGEASFIRPSDKKCITVLIGFKSMLSENGEHTGYLINATDISERKEAESRLRESENRFREMADSAPSMIWMTDEQGIPTYTNKEWLHFTGKDIIGNAKGWDSLVHPDDFEKVISESKTAYQNNEHVTLYYRLRRSDGSFRWVHDVSVPRFLSNGNFIGYIGSVIDIEDEKQKQEELLYQAMILENVSDIIVATDLDFRIKVLNKAAENYYGIVEEEVIGKKLSDFIKFQYVGSTREKALSLLQKNGVWKGEVFVLNNDGEREYFHHTVKFVMDENDSQIGIISTARNITDRKLAGEKLKRSEQFYRTLIADSLDGMLLMDADGKITFASPSVKHVLGYEAEEVIGRNGFEFVHPDDIKWAFESFQKEVIENPDVKFIVVRLLKKTGGWQWCMVRGHNLLKNKYINSLVVYFHDDTLRKQASDALKESERQFRNLIRDIPMGVVLQDSEG